MDIVWISALLALWAAMAAWVAGLNRLGAARPATGAENAS